MTANSVFVGIHDARCTIGLSADSVGLDWAWCHGAGSEGCRHAGVGGILFHARNLMKRPLWEWWRQPRMAAGRGASLPSKTRDGRDGDAGASLPDVTALVLLRFRRMTSVRLDSGWTRAGLGCFAFDRLKEPITERRSRGLLLMLD